MSCQACRRCVIGVVGLRRGRLQTLREVKKDIYSLIDMERSAIAGNSPFGEMDISSWALFPSTTGHEKSCGNLGGPSPKAKYYLTTDSELVP